MKNQNNPRSTSPAREEQGKISEKVQHFLRNSGNLLQQLQYFGHAKDFTAAEALARNLGSLVLPYSKGRIYITTKIVEELAQHKSEELLISAVGLLATDLEELHAFLLFCAGNEPRQGYLPICSHCHRLRNGYNVWMSVDVYLRAYFQVKFTHGVCPACDTKYYGG